jgi:hypothetical protein
MVDLRGVHFVLINDAGLHHEGHMLEDFDVCERVALYGDDICPLAGFE